VAPGIPGVLGVDAPLEEERSHPVRSTQRERREDLVEPGLAVPGDPHPGRHEDGSALEERAVGDVGLPPRAGDPVRRQVQPVPDLLAVGLGEVLLGERQEFAGPGEDERLPHGGVGVPPLLHRPRGFQVEPDVLLEVLPDGGVVGSRPDVQDERVVAPGLDGLFAQGVGAPHRVRFRGLRIRPDEADQGEGLARLGVPPRILPPPLFIGLQDGLPRPLQDPGILLREQLFVGFPPERRDDRLESRTDLQLHPRLLERRLHQPKGFRRKRRDLLRARFPFLIIVGAELPEGAREPGRGLGRSLLGEGLSPGRRRKKESQGAGEQDATHGLPS
jgi:hypothetical protein